MKFSLKNILIIVVLGGFTNLLSAEIVAGSEEEKLVTEHTKISVLASELGMSLPSRGDGSRISGRSGALFFSHIDIAVASNSKLPVKVQRTLDVGATNQFFIVEVNKKLQRVDYSSVGLKLFGNWSLEIPNISGFDLDTQLCQPKFFENLIFPNFTSESAVKVSRLDLNLDGKSQPILGINSLSSHNNEHQLKSIFDSMFTKDNYKVRKVIEEGDCYWQAISPEGIKYKFAKVTKWPTATNRNLTSALLQQEFIPLASPIRPHGLPIYELFQPSRLASVLVTEIEDRFGNKVVYQYDDIGKVESITTSDGDSIVFSYDSVDVPQELTGWNGDKYEFAARTGPYARISSISYNDKVYQYKYSNTLAFINLDDQRRNNTRVDLGRLESVVLPDGRTWEFGKANVESVAEDQRQFDYKVDFDEYSKYDFEVKTPNNLRNIYKIEPGEIFTDLRGTKQQRSLINMSVQNVCRDPDVLATYDHRVIECSSVVPRVVSVDIDVDFSNVSTVFEYEDEIENRRSPHTKVKTKYQGITIEDTYYKYHGYLRGKLISRVFKDSNDTVQMNAVFNWRKLYPELVAPRIDFSVKLGLMFDVALIQDYGQLSARTLLQSITRTVDGSEYSKEYLTYDDYGNVTKIKETSTNSERYLKYQYYNDTINWVIGQPLSSSVSETDSSYTEVNGFEYYPAADLTFPYLLKREKYFGIWTKEYVEYQSDGNVKKIEFNAELKSDPLKNRYVIFDEYYRGTAKLEKRPNRLISSEMLMSRSVDVNGLVTQETDFNGNVTGYGYDELGRLKYIDPSDDKVSDTLITWQYNGGTSGKQPVKIEQHCLLNELKSACEETIFLTKTIIYDSFLRPVLIKLDDGVSAIYVNQAYNLEGQRTFRSFPSMISSESKGTSYQYDVLGRLKKVTTYGGGLTEYDYLSNNRIMTSVKANDSQTNVTTTTYQAYGSPSYDRAIKIESPETVITDIDIDVFGNVQSVYQSYLNDEEVRVGQTEYRAYDSQKRLCQINRSDIGATVYQRNALGEIQWMAEGQTASSNISCNAEALAVDKVTYTYDNLGEQRTISFGDSTPTRTFSYDKNGNVKIISDGVFQQNYDYNAFDLPKFEELSIDGRTFRLNYEYTFLGDLNSIQYPGGDLAKIDFATNGFGQATQAIRTISETEEHVFVEGGENKAVYHPNGIINSFTYGNGVKHLTELDDRNLPSSITDSILDEQHLNLSYTYDFNLNITSIINPKHVSSYSLTSLSYDGLGRMTSSVGGVGIGSSSISYDGLGNILTYSNDSAYNPSDFTYNYGSNHRLTSVTDKELPQQNNRNFDSGYDKRGNVTNNGKRRFTYNLANQLIASGNSEFLYGGYNRRIKSVKDDGSIEYSMYSQSGKLLYRENILGYINYIFLGDKLVAKEGTAVGQPLTDSSEMNYKPFGESIEEPKDEVGFTGHKFDKDLGLSYMQARYYDPVIGRFYSNDPVGWTPKNPVMSFNRYLYVNNNPYKYTDPNGEFLDAIVDIGFIAYDLYDMASNGVNATNSASLGANVAGLFIPGATGLGTAVRAGDKVSDTISVTSNQALRKAKEANGIPRSAQPDKTIKPGTPEGNAAGLDSRNVKQYEYTNGAGEKITIRQDKAATYGQGGKGDQQPHFNAGKTEEGKLNQHHYYEDKK